MNQSFSEFWNETMQIPEARWIVYGTILICSVLVAVYVTFFFRNLAVGKGDEDAAELLTDFRTMRDKGHLQESEYSRLKQVIPEPGKPGPGRIDQNAISQNAEKSEKFITLAEAETRKQSSERGGTSKENHPG